MKTVIMLSLMITLGVSTEVTNLTISQKNSIKNTQTIDSRLRQGDVNIIDSTVEDVTIGTVDNQNISKIEQSHIINSDVSQNIVDINRSSLIRDNLYLDSEISNTHIENGSTVIQSSLKVSAGGTVEDSTFRLDSSIRDAVINNSSISQNEIDVENATVDNLLMSGTHTIHNDTGTVTITNATVTQGKLSVVGNSRLQDSTISMSSSIDESVIENSSVNLCSVYITNGANVSGANINGTCTMTDSHITDGAEVFQGSVVVY